MNKVAISKKEKIVLVVLVGIIALLSLVMYINQDFHAFALYKRTQDTLEIENKDLVICCTYTSNQGEEKTCQVFEKYECSACHKLCEQKQQGTESAPQ